jgi:hypothetical protein
VFDVNSDAGLVELLSPQSLRDSTTMEFCLTKVGSPCSSTRAGQPRKLASPFGRLLRSFLPWQRATASGEIESQLPTFCCDSCYLGEWPESACKRRSGAQSSSRLLVGFGPEQWPGLHWNDWQGLDWNWWLV